MVWCDRWLEIFVQTNKNNIDRISRSEATKLAFFYEETLDGTVELPHPTTKVISFYVVGHMDNILYRAKKHLLRISTLVQTKNTFKRINELPSLGRRAGNPLTDYPVLEEGLGSPGNPF
jgi:hypothetical protein